MIRTLALALFLMFSAGAFAQAAPAPTPPTPAATKPRAVDMIACRDGTMAMIAMKDRICSHHGGVGPPAAEASPEGATAKCKDGTYSFSQHRSGTCSRHGGVANWLGP